MPPIGEEEIARAVVSVPTGAVASATTCFSSERLLLKGAFSFLSARLHVPGKWVSEDLQSGTLDLGRYYAYSCRPPHLQIEVRIKEYLTSS